MALNEDLLFSASEQLFKAATKVKLPVEQQQDLEGLSNVVTLSRRLSNLPDQDARNEYLQLDENIQSILKQWNPEAPYTREPELSAFGTFKERVAKPALEKVVNYSELLNQPYRALRVRQTRGLGWSDAWRLAEGGKALFDLERESKVDNYYEPSVSKIAKQLSTGKTIGEIAATLQSPDDYAAFRRMLEGESVFKEAIKDYDTAKISLGRDLFYKALDIDPGEFGANRKIFNALSGVTDLTTQIFFDPITYIPIAGQAYKASALSITKIIGQEVGSVGRLESITKAFDNPVVGPSVRRFFDTAGPQIEKYAKATDEATRAEAYSALRSQFGNDINPEALQQLAKFEVFNADGARRFLQEQEAADLLIQGRQVKTTPVLPTYTVFRDIRFKLKNVINVSTGLNKRAPILLKTANGEEALSAKEILDRAAEAGLDSTKLTQIQNAIRETQGRLGRFKRVFEIAPSMRGIQFGYQYAKDGKVIKDLGLESAKDVRALMRTAGFSPAAADEIELAWIRANPGERIKMYDGIMLSLANGMGLLDTAAGREVFNRSFRPFSQQKYSTELPLTKELMDSLGSDMKQFIYNLTGASDEALLTGQQFMIDPSLFGGQYSKAVAEWQLANSLRIPPIHEWQQFALSNKNFLFRSMGQFFNGKISSGLVNAWAALTLLPRLGIRSVLEESMVFGLTAPLQVIKNTMLYGYKASRQIRKFTSGERELYSAEALGIPTRLIYALTKNGLSKELKEELKTASKERVAELIIKAQLSGRLTLKGKAAKQFADDLDDFIKFGFGYKYWDDIRQRASQGFLTDPLESIGSGSPQAIARTNGNVSAFNVDYEQATKGLIKGGQYTNVQFGTDQFYLNVLDQIIKTTEFSELGRIAIANIEDSARAIDEMVRYLELNPEIAGRFANAQGLDEINERQLAFAAYLNATIPFRNARGGLNLDLVNKVRTVDDAGKIKISAEDLTLDDLRRYRPEDMPTKILGQAYVPNPQNTGGVMENFVKYGYEWMDRQISTLVREPFFLANLNAYRNVLRPVQQRKYKELVDQGLSEEAADLAARQYAEITAEQLASKRTLEYVDNPAIRTNFAWTMRNFARFYRAQEDFYRRAYRVVFKNPQSIVRFRLATDALDHSGFVFQNDEQTMLGAGEGERYFVFPVDQVITDALAPVTKLLTGKDFAFPMPLEFTGKVKMLTPSLDPEAAIPSFSGPLAGLTFVTLERMLPNFMGPIKDNLLQTTLGAYAKNVSWTDVALPSNVRRAISAFNQDDQDSQFASAARKAMAYYAANGMSLPMDATEAEKYEFRQRLEATAMNVIVTRFFLGMISPVAPQVGFGEDIPRYLKDAGNVNFKSEFNKLVNELAAKGEPDVYNKALQQWTKINPGLLAYTIGETDANKVATVKKTKDAATWVKNNRDLVKAYPEGSAFFIPFTGEFGFDEYAFLKREGYIEALPVEDFLKRVQVAEDRFKYEQLKKEYDDKIEAAVLPSMKTMYREEWSTIREDYLSDKPLLVEDLEFRGSEQQTRNALEDLRKMINEDRAPSIDLTNKYRKMIEVFDNAELSLSVLTSNTRFQRAQRDRIRKGALQQIEAIAAGDPQAEAAVRVLFRRLIGV